LKSHRAKIIIAALGYVVMAILVTYPAIHHMTSAPAGLDNEDAFQYVWSLWWTKKALLDLRISPAHLTHLYHPSEPYHAMLIVSPFVQLLPLPLVLAVGPIVAYNVEFLLSFILTGIATYLLCYHFTRNGLASFVGGVIFAFFPNKMLHSLGHLPQMTLYLFPIYVLFLFLLLEKPSLRRAIGLGLVLALSALVHIIHIAYFLIPLTLVFVLWHLLTDRQRILAPDFWKCAGLAFLLASVLTAPLFVPFILDSVSGKLTYLEAGGSEAYSADVLNLFTPSADHPVLGPLLRQLPFPIPGHKDDEILVYVGLVPLILAAVGCAGNWRRRGMWVALGLSAAILACGPFLKVGGQPMRLAIVGREWRILLPYALLLRLPFYEWGRNPSRLVDTAMLACAVLVSYGTATLLARLRALGLKIALLAVIAVLILFEYLIVHPFPVGQTPIPDFYRKVAAEEGYYAILDIPFRGWSASNTNMYYQAVHQHPIVGGFIHRVPAGVRPMMSFFSRLVTPFGGTADILERLSGPDTAAILRHYDIAFVVLHKPALTLDELPLWIDLLRSFPAETAFEDEQIVSFRVPEIGRIPRLKPLLVVGENWHDIQLPNGTPSRWMSNDGLIYAGISQDGEYELGFTTSSPQGPRRLRVYVNEGEVGEFHVQGKRSYSLGPLSLQGEDWTSIRFHAVEGCEVSAGQDLDSEGEQCLSLLFENVSLQPI
jgi:hypothetical protein